jgi:hypothetical protein
MLESRQVTISSKTETQKKIALQNSQKKLTTLTKSLKGRSFFLDVPRHQQAVQLKNWIEQLGGVCIIKK